MFQVFPQSCFFPSNDLWFSWKSISLSCSTALSAFVSKSAPVFSCSPDMSISPRLSRGCFSKRMLVTEDCSEPRHMNSRVRRGWNDRKSSESTQSLYLNYWYCISLPTSDVNMSFRYSLQEKSALPYCVIALSEKMFLCCLKVPFSCLCFFSGQQMAFTQQF